jgi:HlyD family secretion protein
MKKLIHKIKWRKLIKFIIIIAVLGTAGYLGYQKFFAKENVPANTVASYTVSKVETRTIQNVLSSSGTIEPLNTYDVTALVQGTVISADFEEGDYVEEGQVLYQISTDTLDNEVETAQTKVTRAEKELAKAKENYSDAVDSLAEAKSDYNEAKEKNGSTKVKATETGVIKTLYVKEGDTLQKGAQIAEVYDNSYMLLTVPFNSSEVKDSLVGKAAVVTISDSFETLDGEVTEVSSIDQALSGNQLVRNVTIKVKNPGGITETTKATAAIGNLYSAGDGSFSVLTNTVMSSSISGEIDSLSIKAGSKVTEGDVIITLTQDSVDDQLSNYVNAVENAQKTVDSASESIESAEESLEDAQTALDDTIDSKTDYSITAPISGEIIRKDTLAGDTIKSSAMSSTLCVIYDLSAVTFSMYVDELDVLSVKEGQEVEVTADALEGVTFTGVVTNVSLESTASSGVTQYPVTVRIDEVGDLLPGMNVTGNIIIEEAENCLAIPSDALQRGNVVYVKDDSVTEAQGNVPAGFKEVTVETGITDGDYVQITSGLDGTEEVYAARNISTQAVTGEESLLDGLGLGGSSSSMPSGGNFGGGSSNWSGGSSRSSGNMGGGSFGGPGQ